MPGNNSAPVAVGDALEFAEDGVTNGLITRFDVKTFTLRNIGVYEVQFQASIAEAAQLVIALDDGTGVNEVKNSVCGRATGANQVTGVSLIETTVANTKLSIRNPIGNSTALSMTPFAGGTHAVSCHLVIKQLA